MRNRGWELSGCQPARSRARFADIPDIFIRADKCQRMSANNGRRRPTSASEGQQAASPQANSSTWARGQLRAQLKAAGGTALALVAPAAVGLAADIR